MIDFPGALAYRRAEQGRRLKSAALFIRIF
jgi:hypothetical protein